MNLKVFKLLILVSYCCILVEISGQCLVELTKDPSVRPTFFKFIGSRIAMIPNMDRFIEIQESGEITAQCATRFIKPAFAINNKMVTLKCTGNKINSHYNRMEFECDSMTWNLYESSTPFRWCPPTMASYILARPVGVVFEYLAGICYNFAEMKVLSLHYAAATKDLKHVYPHRLRNYEPAEEVQNIAISFHSRNITIAGYDNPQFQEWMQFANYQNHSLMQNPHLYSNYYNKLGGLLDFAWWPGLRLGNWRLYEEALSQYLEAGPHVYEILAGISGTVAAPIYEGSCQENRTLVELVDRSNRKIPLYVWHYLKSTRNVTDDNLVVIGVNSPFNDFYTEKDLVFCNNICHQIDWLQKVHSIFDHKAMGLIFCCSVDEVKTSMRLHGFPLPAKTATPKPPPLPILRLQQTYDDLDDPNQSEYQTEDNGNDY